MKFASLLTLFKQSPFFPVRKERIAYIADVSKKAGERNETGSEFEKEGAGGGRGASEFLFLPTPSPFSPTPPHFSPIFCSPQARSLARPLTRSLVRSLRLEKERKRLLSRLKTYGYELLVNAIDYRKSNRKMYVYLPARLNSLRIITFLKL